MKKPIITLLVTFFGGILYAAIWTKILDFYLTYSELGIYESFLVFSAIFLCFYYSGVYINAALFGFFFKKEIDTKTSPLELYGLCGSFLLSFLVTLILFFVLAKAPYRDSVFYIVFGIFLFFLLSIISIIHVVMIRVAHEFETNESLKYLIVKTSTVLLINLTLVFVVCINDFPGANAPIEFRQQWAYKKVKNYPEIMDFIKENNQITDKIGQIKFVAPRKKRSLPITIGGSGNPVSELTLEVVGEKGKGIAYIITFGSGMHGWCFEFQGEKIKASDLGSCED